jgi:hypothetical protein
MRRTHLGLQAAIVLTMVAFVSWPQFRPAHTQSVWRYFPSAVLQAKADDAARFAGTAAAGQHSAMHVAQTSLVESTQAGAVNVAGSASTAGYRTPEAVIAAGGKLNAVLGIARTSLNMPIPFARIVLRNIGTGQVFSRTMADEQGAFSFVDLDANAYIVELLDQDGAVVATSSMLTMTRGDVKQTIVRAASAASTINVSFGNNTAPSLPRATTVAASNDVTPTSSAVQTQESPR